ncbi:MAG: carboxypeptidase-like regulatory domain-containing protein, partial [Paludibacter sp.]
MRKKIIYLLLAVFVSTGTLLAQNLRVNGVIVDKKTGETLIGANVVQKGTTNGTVTNLDGAFSLSVPQGSVLIMSYLGYISQEVVVSNEAPLRIQLVSNTELLDEVVVVGYGTQKVKDMTA